MSGNHNTYTGADFLELLSQIADRESWAAGDVDQVVDQLEALPGWDAEASWWPGDDGEPSLEWWGQAAELLDASALPGSDDLADFARLRGPMQAAQEARDDEHDLGSQIAGAVEGSLEDAAELSEAGQEGARSLLRHPLMVAGAVLGGLGLVAVLRS